MRQPGERGLAELSCIELDECINYVKFLALVFVVVGVASNKRKKVCHFIVIVVVVAASIVLFCVFF